MNASANNRSSKLSMTSSGFTLIELMVTIAVLAIIVSIAAPNISNQIANQRNKSTAATLENALKEAKAESMIRRQTLTFTYDNKGDDDAGTIVIAQGANTIASYSYSAKSKLSDSASKPTITFEPSKRVDALAYTICDDNSNATVRQVSISSVMNISSQTGGKCS